MRNIGKSKPFVAALLCAALLCGSLGAMAAVGDAELFARDLRNPAANVPNVNDMAVVGDTLYMLADGGLYSYHAGDAEPTELLLPIGVDAATFVEGPAMDEAVAEFSPEASMEEAPFRPDRLMDGGETLLGLESGTGRFGPWDGEAFQWEGGRLDWQDMIEDQGDYTQIREIRRPTLVDGAIYMLVAKEMDSWGEYALRRFDMDTGEVTVLPAEQVQQFTPYTPGKLAAVCMSMEDWTPRIVVIDAATGQEESTLVNLDPRSNQLSGLAYDPVNGMLYCTIGGEILPVEEGALGQPVAYLAANSVGMESAAVTLGGGYYALQTYQGVFVRNLDPLQQPTAVLRVAGGYMDDVTTAFTRDHPDIAVVMAQSFPWSDQEIADTMVSKDESVDIFQVYGAGTLDALYEKGYLKDMSASQALVDAVGRMYPQLQELVMRDGKLFALPINLSGNFWRVNTGALEALDLGGMPATMEDWLELNRRWYEEELAETYPDYTLYSGDWVNKDYLLDIILTTYMSQYTRPGEPLQMDTPELRATLERWEALPEFGRDDEGVAGGGTVVYSSFDVSQDPAVLMELSAPGLSPYFSGRIMETQSQLAAPPPFVAGQEAPVAGSVQAFVINPNTANYEAALTYLEYMAENADELNRYTLYPDLNEPVPDPFAASNLAQQEEALKEMEADLELAEGADKKNIQDGIDMMKQSMERLQNFRWRISPETLAEYRKMAPLISLEMDSAYSNMQGGGAEELSGVMQRYMDGQLRLDDMLREMDKLMRMIYLEAQ